MFFMVLLTLVEDVRVKVLPIEHNIFFLDKITTYFEQGPTYLEKGNSYVGSDFYWVLGPGYSSSYKYAGIFYVYFT